jgi:hypothetical protein
MSTESSLELKVVDGLRLDEDVRSALRPGALIEDRQGRARRLPRYFYEVPSWQFACEFRLSPNFSLWEFLNVDLRENEQMRQFPRYAPCAVTSLAAHLEVFRGAVGTVVHIAANGGYRSPSHEFSGYASPHLWGTAVNIYRIGDQMLDEKDQIGKFGRLARDLLPGVCARPFGQGPLESDDHLHLDIGFVNVVPHDAPGEGGEQAAEALAGAGEEAK